MPVTFRRRDNLKFTEAEKRVGQAIRAGFEPLGNELVESIKADSPNDRGGFRKGVRKRISGTGFRTRMIIYDSAPHAEWVEKGREPGKQPPPDVMRSWVRRHGLGASAFSIKTRRQIAAGTRRIFSKATGKRRTAAQSLQVIQKGIVFVIGRAIGKRGIKGLFLFKNLKSKHAEKISAAITQIKVKVAQILNG